MNFLSRVKIPHHLLITSPVPRKCLFSLRPISCSQQSYRTGTDTTSNSKLKVQEPKKPSTQKYSESSLSWSQRVKKQAETLAVWPRPTEIPYQAKVANSVNLIGYVKTPVRFESTPDGKHWAVTAISQENGNDNKSSLIPIVFESDLAHVVACHVKENDCVYVAGQLSVDPLPLVLSESLGKYHVVVQNLNFVEGLKKSLATKKKGVSTVEEPVNKWGAMKKEVSVVSDDGDSTAEDDETLNRERRDALEHAKNSRSLGMKNDDGSIRGSKAAATPEAAAFEDNRERVFGNESKPEKGNVKSGEIASKKRNGETNFDSWRDLVKNPEQWWDFRQHKSNGLVKEKHPDFKHKESGDGLWVDNAPKWVLAGLGKLEFDVMVFRAKQVQYGQGIKRDGKGDDSWKNLVENPDKWWDNRSNKRNPKQPDFKHKETGEVLWLNRSPDWALSRLPPLRDGQTSAAGKKNDYTGGKL
ncbi:protein OSB4, chloroplastic-like [Olea europaea var. sylvestris]|uniref:OSB2, chloroplastic-like n=1 Tax=Olea europaea subsp. europaea TaxID=158383 RepID=A0A8S0RGX3_OLEEU|nr:protein OSB4, chloroplastic-like [Olea europaea var. sylvestris]CAA2978380.1 OSB2, chloroplastic-like [Olea europaea subsp. europaea]